MSKVKIKIGINETQEAYKKICKLICREQLKNEYLAKIDIELFWGKSTEMRTQLNIFGDLLNLFSQIQKIIGEENGK